VGAEGLLDEVLAALSEGETVFSQGALAEVLLDSGPDSVTELRMLLGDPRHPRRRRLIVVVLGELRAFDAVPELVGALQDPDDELCARACHALGKIGDPDSADALGTVSIDGGRPWFVRTAAAGACGQIGDPRTADTLVDVLDTDEWYPRNAAAAALVRLGDAGLAAVCRRVSSLEPESVAHYWGVLDAAGQTEDTIIRAAAGERRVRRFVTAAARAGATARLEELAARETPSGRYAATVLRPPARDTRSGRYTAKAVAAAPPRRLEAVAT
jgi:hypothetical protein